MKRLFLIALALVACAGSAHAGKEYCLVRNSDNTLMSRQEFKTPPPPPIGHRWVPALRTAEPTFDPMTQVKEWSLVIFADRCEDTFAVRAKTTQEMNDTRDLYLSQWGQIERRLAFDQENRIRALEGKAAFTLPQFLTFIRSLF